MVSIPKVVGVLSCSFLLCLGLSYAAQAGNAVPTTGEMKADQSDRRQGGQEAGEKQMSDEMKGDQSKDGKMIKGEVLRVEGKGITISSRGRTVRKCACISTKPLRKSEALSRVIVLRRR